MWVIKDEYQMGTGMFFTKISLKLGLTLLTPARTYVLSTEKTLFPYAMPAHTYVWARNSGQRQSSEPEIIGIKALP